MSAAELELERVVDSYGGPFRKMRQKICRLKLTIRGLSQQHDTILNDNDDDSGDGATNLDSDGSNDSEFEEGDVTPVQRKRPKLGSYKKKAGADAARDAARKYKQRKYKELEDAVNNLFNNVLSTPPKEVTPRSLESHRRGEEALKWALHRLLTENPVLWAHVLREKRTVQEAEEAAMARIRRHWEDKALGL